MEIDESQEDLTKPKYRSAWQKYMLYAAMIVTVLRFILRTVFVIVTAYLPAIALMAISLLCLALLITLQRRGGCSMTIFYIVCELVFGTIWWIIILYVLDTNDLCREVSGACKDIDTS